MEAAWGLKHTIGPNYREVIEKFPDKYFLRRGNVYSANFKKIAVMKFPGRSFQKTSLVINHDFEDKEKLELSLGLARLLEENNCSDFDENPRRDSLEIVHANRFE